MLTRTTFSARHLNPSHHAMFAADITAFGCRNPRLGLYARSALYDIIRQACDAAGICWDRCYHEDRGDGLVALASPGDSIEKLADPFVMNVRNGLHEHNKILAGDTQIRLRMAIHAGYVYADAHGISGPDLIHLFRLLDAPGLKRRFAQHPGDFALIASDHLYREIISYSPGQLRPGDFQPTSADIKETHSQAWIWLPADPAAAQHDRPAAHLSQVRPQRGAAHSRHPELPVPSRCRQPR